MSEPLWTDEYVAELKSMWWNFVGASLDIGPLEQMAIANRFHSELMDELLIEAERDEELEDE